MERFVVEHTSQSSHKQPLVKNSSRFPPIKLRLTVTGKRWKSSLDLSEIENFRNLQSNSYANQSFGPYYPCISPSICCTTRCNTSKGWAPETRYLFSKISAGTPLKPNS